VPLTCEEIFLRLSDYLDGDLSLELCEEIRRFCRDNADEAFVKKYSKYDACSIDFLATLFWIIPVGTGRIIRNSSGASLPVLNDFETSRCWENEDKLAELTLLTVRRRFRRYSRIAFLLILRRLYRFLKQKGSDEILMAADKRLFFLLRRIHFPIRQIGKEKMYEGSITYPAYLDFRKAEEIMKRESPWIYRFFISK